MFGTATNSLKKYPRHYKKTSRIGSIIRWLLGLFFCCVIVYSANFIFQNYKNEPFLPIKSVKIEGYYRHVERHAIMRILSTVTNREFLFVDTKSLEDQISQLPWVSEVSISRQWPDTLVIHLSEHKPIARWSSGRLLSTTGIIFSPNSHEIDYDLPTLNAPDGTQAIIWEGYQKMSALLTKIGLRISRLDLEARQSWTLTLNNGMRVILGKDNGYTRIGRFVDSYAKIIGSRGANVDYVDLRYSNGLAIHWK